MQMYCTFVLFGNQHFPGLPASGTHCIRKCQSVKGLRLEVNQTKGSIPVRGKTFLISPQRPTRLWKPQFKEYSGGGVFPVGKLRGACCSPHLHLLLRRTMPSITAALPHMYVFNGAALN
jgi:hypothetical protein